MEYGVYRYGEIEDAARHIETPADDEFASDFWPTVIGSIRNYADYDLYIYGEILNTVGDNFNIGNYTKYMSVSAFAVKKEIHLRNADKCCKMIDSKKRECIGRKQNGNCRCNNR